MKKTNTLLIVILLFSVIMVIAGCKSNSDNSETIAKQEPNKTTELVVCNDPYIKVGFSCCLDKNQNKICDTDETTAIKNEVQTVTDEEELKKVAKAFGVYTEKDKFSEMYDMLTEERKNYKTKEEFIELYPLVFYGTIVFLGDDGRPILNKTNPNPVSSASFNEVFVKDDEGFVYYNLIYNDGSSEKSGAYKFKKEGGSWRFNGFSYLVYAGCFKSSDCHLKPDKLQSNCENTCKAKGYGLKTTDQFTCTYNICFCECQESEKVVMSVKPEFK